MRATVGSQIRVGKLIAFPVFWTVILVVGLALGLLVGIRSLADLVQRASASTTDSTLVVAVAVAMLLCGVWGIAASHRNLKHAVDLIDEVDRARTETLVMESARHEQRPK
jgi:hypothetical protein